LHRGAARRLTVGNDAAGIARLVAWASPGALVVMEASGVTSAWRIAT
jgi:transposase